MSRKIYFSLLMLIICTTYASAQKLRGSVYDENGEALPSATIVIEGTNYSTLTNDKGEFRFRHLPNGTFHLSASFVGYTSQKQEITINENSSQTIRFDLKISNTLNEVEVFGERYKQPEKLETITRMPLRPSEQIQSISVISDKVIAEQGALTITDAMRNVPGVTLFGSYGGVKESMSSRGFRGVPILKNGVRIDSQFQTASGVIDMQGVESMQMIKGSAAITQGVITDIGNAGGIINIVTKTPKFINAGEANLRVGSWGLIRPSFDVQAVLDKNRTVAIRLNGAYEHADNYRKYVSANKAYINPSLEWRPDDKTTINLELDYLNEDRTPVTSTVNLADIDTEALYEMPYDKFLGFKGIDNVNTKNLTYSARINRMITDKLSIRAAYFNSSYNVDNTSTGLGTVKESKAKDAPINYDLRQRTITRSQRDDKNTTFQLDFIGRDVYTGSVKHTFQLGFDYRMADAYTTALGSMLVDTINVLNPVNNTAPKLKGLGVAADPVRSKYSTYGLMAQEVMTINQYLKLILGLRYSSISNLSATAGNDIRDAWNPLVGVMVTPIKNVNVFASYTTSTSLRSAGNILTDSITEAGPSTTKQFEVGFKSDWLGDRLRFNFTYFDIITENLTNSFYAEGSSVASPYYFKAGDLKRKGVEVELNGRILDNLQVMLGYAYLDAKYVNSPSYVDGSSPMNAPKHTANGWIQYTVDRSILKGLSIGVGTYYVGERPVNDWSNSRDGHGTTVGVKPFDMPAYTTVTAQLGYTKGPVTARIYFNNIFDELGYNSYFRGGYINQIEPRNFAGSLSFRF